MKYKGFTLIEVLIVVIIIGILATLMLPQIGSMAERARTAEAKNMIGALRTLLATYYMESNAWPTGTLTTNVGINNALGTAIKTDRSLFNYSLTASGANMTITATRNTFNWSTGNQRSVVTLTIDNSGNPTGNLSTTWDSTAPVAPN